MSERHAGAGAIPDVPPVLAEHGHASPAGQRDQQIFELETHGFDFIPEAERYLTVRKLGLFWVGTNAYIFYVVIGTLAFGFGLSLLQCALALLVGNLMWVLVGVASIGGARSGLPTMTFTRAAFGLHGNKPNGLAAWFSNLGFEAINTVLGVFAVVALLDELSIGSGGAVEKLFGLVVVFGAAGVLAIFGEATMVWFQRIFAVALTLILACVFVAIIGDVSLTASQPSEEGMTGLPAWLLVISLIVASGPLSYMAMAADYPRYLPTRTPARSIAWSVTVSAGSIALFLGVLGAMLASQGDMSDPVAGVAPLVPQWLYVLFILATIGGTISNSAPTIYSSGLVMQAMGFSFPRWVMTFVDVVIATFLILYALFVEDFTTALADFLVLYVIWLGPFGGVWLADGFMRRWRYDPVQLHAGREGIYYGGEHGINWRGVTALMLGVGSAALLVNAPKFTGPLVDPLLGGGDLAWLVPIVVSATAYYFLARRHVAGQLRGQRLPADGEPYPAAPAAAGVKSQEA